MFELSTSNYICFVEFEIYTFGNYLEDDKLINFVGTNIFCYFAKESIDFIVLKNVVQFLK
jgi:hypothetical protein